VQAASLAEGAAGLALHPSLVNLADVIPVPFVGFLAHGIDAALKCAQSGL
jgi:hypothetical protein